jgi:hypothetical protein
MTTAETYEQELRRLAIEDPDELVGRLMMAEADRSLSEANCSDAVNDLRDAQRLLTHERARAADLMSERERARAELTQANAALVTAGENVERCAAAVAAVVELHQPRRRTVDGANLVWCRECQQDWPCPTDRATDEAVNGKPEVERF